MIVRILNDKGIAAFRQYLAALRGSPGLPPPVGLAEDAAQTAVFDVALDITPQQFQTKREAASYLDAILTACPPTRIAGNTGLWAWLSLVYFDSLCPLRNGKRKPKADVHYIPDFVDYRRSYRHLLYTTYQVLREMPSFNRLILDRPADVHGEIIEQWMSRLFLRRVPGVAEAAEILYYDPDSPTKHKPGAMPKEKDAKRGDFRNRFYVRVRQLTRTYDLFALNGHQLVQLLGSEFRDWATPCP